MNRLEICDLHKSYSTVPVLSGVSFTLAPGEILGLAGENGAGKSTLIKCLNGGAPITRGGFRLDGRECAFATPSAAMDAGVVTVPQEFNLINTLSVYENFYLGRERKTRFGLLDRKAMRENCRAALARLHCNVDPDALVGSINVAAKQFIEIARALDRKCSLLIMDEPTTVLNGPESEILFDIMRKLSGEGVSILFVSHKLHEVKAVCDRVVVLRDGVVSGDAATADVEPDEIARMMVGRELSRKFPELPGFPADAPVVLEARSLSGNPIPTNVSFSLRAGEILGIAGLGGSGRSELAETIYGLRRKKGGELVLLGEKRSFRSPSAAVANKVALLPEDRQGAGVLLDFSVGDNISLEVSNSFVIDRRAEREKADFFIERFRIKVGSQAAKVRSLSGGNQQKVALAKQLATEPRIFIFDEPTRGVDVGARSEVYGFIAELAKQGVGCILISSDLEEVIGMCRRVLVMRGGTLAGELTGDRVTEEEIMYLATGVK